MHGTPTACKPGRAGRANGALSSGAWPKTTDPVDRRIWLDGELVPWEQATVHILSHSLQRGSLIFDYMSVHETARGPAVFRLREHVGRFLDSARLVGLPLVQTGAEIEAAILDTVRAQPGRQGGEGQRLPGLDRGGRGARSTTT